MPQGGKGSLRYDWFERFQIKKAKYYHGRKGDEKEMLNKNYHSPYQFLGKWSSVDALSGVIVSFLL